MSTINLDGIDWTRPCVELIDEVTDMLLDQYHEENGRDPGEARYEQITERADRIVMARLK